MIKAFCNECGCELKHNGSLAIGDAYVINEICDVNHGAKKAHLCADCLRKLLAPKEKK